MHLYINVHDDPAKPKAPTLVDVAREARVSLKTASRVLNGSARVKEEVVNSVRDVMSRLNYRPNELARGLKAHKSAAIEMIVVDSSDPFTASVVKAVQEIAQANGYTVVLASPGGYPAAERFHIVLTERAVNLPDAIDI